MLVGLDLQLQSLVLGERLVELADVAGDISDVEFGHAVADFAGFGPRNHQQRVEGADQPFRLLDGLLEHAR